MSPSLTQWPTSMDSAASPICTLASVCSSDW